MAILRVKNWAAFQHYKKRSPPWIKLHRSLLDDYEFICLPDASAALAPRLWLLASESEDGSINCDIAKISFRLHMTEERLIQALGPLVDGGFIHLEGDASGALARRLQDSLLETEGEGEGETEREGDSSFVRTKAVVVSNGNDPTPDLPSIPEGLQRESSGEASSRLPVQKAFDNYNIAAGDYGLPQAGKLTEDRRRKLRQRLKEHGIEGWNKALCAIENTPFLRGDNDRGWRADLDFLLQPKSLNKVIEGGYASD